MLVSAGGAPSEIPEASGESIRSVTTAQLSWPRTGLSAETWSGWTVQVEGSHVPEQDHPLGGPVDRGCSPRDFGASAHSQQRVSIGISFGGWNSHSDRRLCIGTRRPSRKSGYRTQPGSVRPIAIFDSPSSKVRFPERLVPGTECTTSPKRCGQHASSEAKRRRRSVVRLVDPTAELVPLSIGRGAGGIVVRRSGLEGTWVARHRWPPSHRWPRFGRPV